MGREMATRMHSLSMTAQHAAELIDGDVVNAFTPGAITSTAVLPL